MLRVVSLFVFFGLGLAKHENYDGHALLKLSVKSTEQTELVDYLSHALDLDVWALALPGRDGQVLVPKKKKLQFQNELKDGGVEFIVETDNIKELLDFEDKLLSEASKKSNASLLDSLPFDQIYTYHQVDTFLDLLAEAYPDTVALVNAGKSFEGRDIKYVKISSTNFEDTSKPIVFIESLLHAREWITLPVTLYAIHKLVIDVTDQDLVEDIDWIILPIANPDGYIHTHEESRLWRKNRSTNYSPLCTGVDLNRNFDIHWSEASSDIVCSDTFHGAVAFSEPETSIVKDIFDQYSSRIELFLDIHSFGSMILYGFGNAVLPPNGLMLHLLGVQMAHAIDAVKMSWNSDYIVGNVALVLYQASGSAGDYALAVGIPYSYTYELPGYRFSIGGLGFLVDPAFIEQAGFETWEGIKAGARFVRNNLKKMDF